MLTTTSRLPLQGVNADAQSALPVDYYAIMELGIKSELTLLHGDRREENKPLSNQSSSTGG